MLDLQDEGGRLRLADAISRIKCEIEFPEAWSEFLNHSGPAGSVPADNRRFRRWKNRTLAGLLQCETYPVIPRNEQWRPIYLKDVSRGGVAFVHSEQLYPLERMRILFIDEVSSRLLENYYLRIIEVVRCKYVRTKCYEVGAQFVVD